MRAPGRPRAERTWAEGWSLSARLVVTTVVLLALGLGLAGVTVIAVLRSQLVDQVDENLHDTVETIAQEDLEEIRAGDDQVVPTRYVVSITFEGRATQTVAHPRTSDSVGLPVLPDRAASQPTTVDGTHDRVSWRALALPLVDASGDQVGVLTLSTPMDEISATLQETGKYVVLISFSLLVLGATFGYLLIRHELRDLRAIERTAGAIAAGDLTKRIPPGPRGTEIGSLSESLNTMLSQIERAFSARSASERRMRRFVADASHELRTPLATVRGYAELHRMGGVPTAEVPAAMGRIESEATRMGTLVEDLLALARIDEARRLELTEVDLAEVAKDAVRDLRALDPTRRARLVPLPDHPGPTVVRADADQVRQVFANLVGNTVRHTPDGTDVEILVGYRAATPTHPPTPTDAPAPTDTPPDDAGAAQRASVWAAVGRLGSPAEGGVGAGTSPGGAASSSAPATSSGSGAIPGNRTSGGAGRPDRAGTEDLDATLPRISSPAAGAGRRTVPDRRLLGLLGGRGPQAVATAPLSPAPVPHDQVVLRVQDHGPGIPAEEAKRVFTRFYRLDRSRARSAGGGSGLGLAIVASVARAHGGEARVLATPGGGTTVEITLPVDGPTSGMATTEDPRPKAV